ncbi:hypothetical protein HPB49_006908 [Dermacentor silvarum]|uniref:Uncharacterized protein n=1 Tax=Dermacentor silvarum TaxID=543639 RepID=A0ACB8D3J1_DERSI|nr:hypothetical protein HPB49_006908 [Dermacentor silvarum]
MGSHLLQLRKAKAGLERRWQRQRWNTTFRRRLTQFNKETETHAATLSRQNGGSLCNRLEHSINLPQTWNLSRHLIDSTQSKTRQKQIMTKLIDASEASPQELLQTLRGLHFPAYPPGDHPLYRLPNDLLDKTIREAKGVYLDWDYPGDACGSPNDTENLIAFVADLRSLNLSVILAVPPEPALVSHYNLPRAMPLVEYVVVKTHTLRLNRAVYCSGARRYAARVFTDVRSLLPPQLRNKLAYSISVRACSRDQRVPSQHHLD